MHKMKDAHMFIIIYISISRIFTINIFSQIGCFWHIHQNIDIMIQYSQQFHRFFSTKYSLISVKCLLISNFRQIYYQFIFNYLHYTII